jgi:hypothetical protein
VTTKDVIFQEKNQIRRINTRVSQYKNTDRREKSKKQRTERSIERSKERNKVENPAAVTEPSQYKEICPEYPIYLSHQRAKGDNKRSVSH